MFPRLLAVLALVGIGALALPTGRQEPLPDEVDSDETRRVLGSSVVTSVSVIMDLGHGGAALLSESPVHNDNAAGSSQQSETFANSPLSTQKRPVGSPPALMSPDRYEFYTFDESGELVRRLMTLEQIQSLIAGGDDANRLAALTADLEDSTLPAPAAGDPQEEVVANVQQVLAEELLASIQKNGSEPQEGEVEVEAVVQEVPPPPSSTLKPERPMAEDEGSHDYSDASSQGSEDVSGSTDSSGEDASSQVTGDESASSSSQESSVGGESGGGEDSGVANDSGFSQQVTESSSEEYGDSDDSSTSGPTDDASDETGDKAKPSDSTEYVSEKYGIYHISATPQASTAKDDVEVTTLIYADEKTTVMVPTESTLEEEKITPPKHPEMPFKNITQSDNVNVSSPIEPIEDDEATKESSEDEFAVHTQTDLPEGSMDHSELTNKNPPTVLPGMQPDESEFFSDPIPEFTLTPMKPLPGQTADSSGIKLHENAGTTTQIPGELATTSAESLPPFDLHVDEIPTLAQTTDFQPPEEADLSAFFAENNQTSTDASDEEEEDPIKIQGLLGLFSDKFSELMGGSDSLNEAGGQEVTTTEKENISLQGGPEEPNQMEIQEPSPSLLPPLVGDEEKPSVAQIGVTETNYIKDQNTPSAQEEDDEDSDLLDELAESVSGILSQVSDFVDDSEVQTPKIPVVDMVHTDRIPTVNPAVEIAATGETSLNTTPAQMSSVEVLSADTSTHAVHAVHDDIATLGEETTTAYGTDERVSVKPDYDDHLSPSISGSTTDSDADDSASTYDAAGLSGSSSTAAAVETDGTTVIPDEESAEDATKVSKPLKTTMAPSQGNDGYDSTTSAGTSDEGEITFTAHTEHTSGVSMATTTENVYGQKKPAGDANEDVSDSMTEGPNVDERFESTSVISESGESDATLTTQRYELFKGGDDATEKVNDPEKVTTDKYSDERVTTENILPGKVSAVTSEIFSDGTTLTKDPVTQALTENSVEYSTVTSAKPAIKPLVNKTDDEYLLEEMHKVAEEQSDPLLSTYAEDEETEVEESSPSSLKDKHENPEVVDDNDDDENEAGEGSTKPATTTDHLELIHSSTEVIADGEGDQSFSTESPSADEESSSTESPDESEKEDGTAKPMELEDSEQSVDTTTQVSSETSTEDRIPSVSVDIKTDAVKPTTYRPLSIPLATSQVGGVTDNPPSSSPDDLPDPNGLSTRLGEKEEPVTVNPPSEEDLPSSTEKASTASAAVSSSPGISSHVPPLMPAFPPAPTGNMGLEATSSSLDPDVKLFVDLCNDLAFSLYSQVTGASQSVPNIRGTHGSGVQTRSLVVSPFAISSLLAMVFLGARGPTSEQMNDLLHLDDVITFNPHLVLQNVTESVITSPGVSAAAFVRELYSDKTKGHLLEFYKARAKAFYEGHVEEVDFNDVNDVIRRRTNHLVRWQTRGRVPEYLRGSSLRLRPPLAALSANFFEADCQRASSTGTDGEMYFEVPAMGRRRRRLVPIPAVVWRGVFLAGHDPGLDATVLELRHGGGEVSTVLVLPGRHGQSVPDEPTGGLARLETWLAQGGKASWSSLLRSAVPRGPIEVQLPRFAHRSVLNVTGALTRMGLPDLFTGGKADLRGLDGSLGGTLHLSDAIQMTAFGVCAEDGNSRRHLETYPSAQRTGRAGGEEGEDEEEEAATDETTEVSGETSTEGAAETSTKGAAETSTAPTTQESSREGRRASEGWGEDEGLDEQSYAFAAAEAARELPLALRPRQARIPRPPQGPKVVLPRLRFDRPFLYFVRHNPSGFILLMGRFNPRLFP